MGRVPPAERHGHRAGKRIRDLGLPRRSGRHWRATGPARTVSDAALAYGPRPEVDPAQLFPFRSPGREHVSSQRKARAARPRQSIRPRPGTAGRSPGRCCTAGHLYPAAVRRAGPFAERRSGCDAGAGDAPCAGGHPVQPRCLVAARRPQPGRGALRNRVTVAAAGRYYQRAGRLTASVLATLDLPRDSDAYICGPAEFMTEMASALRDLGVDASRIRTEIFGPAPAITPGVMPTPTRSPHHPENEATDGPQIGFARSGLTVHWDARYASLLDLAEACDVPARWSCRTGVCHTCETSLLSGTIGYAPDPVDNPADGNVLICCSHPVDDTVLDM